MDLITGLGLARRILIWLCIAMGLAGLAGFGYLQTQARDLNRQIVTLRAEAAAQAANRPVMEMTIADAQSVIAEAASDIERACRLSTQLHDRAAKAGPDADAFLNLTWNVCPSTPGSARPVLAKFQPVYFKAVSARLAGRYATAEALYRQAVDIAASPAPPGGGGVSIPDEWKVRALEGLAYSELKRGRTDDALRDVSHAQTLAPPGKTYVFAETTALKARCHARPLNAAQVRAGLDAARGDLDKMIAGSKDNAQCFAKLDRKTLEEDAELFADCAAAGVKPMKVSGPDSCDAPGG